MKVKHQLDHKIGQYKTSLDCGLSIKRGLGILENADYGLGIKRGLGLKYKVGTVRKTRATIILTFSTDEEEQGSHTIVCL